MYNFLAHSALMSLIQLCFVPALIPFLANAAVVRHSSNLSFLAKPAVGKYGNGKCPCVGIDNLAGYNSVTYGNGWYTQYPIEFGASCEAWEQDRDQACKGSNAPDWCSQKWCYVDPCNCDLEILPKQTASRVMWQGSTAYFSYNTCGGKDSYSASEIKDACVNQENEASCSKVAKCAWDGKQCGGIELVKNCKAKSKLDEAVHGQDDCRCVGFDNKNGQARMFVNSTYAASYPADVGGSCKAWENKVHPKCLTTGSKPDWCEQKWCFVDPCKCKTAVPPKAVANGNEAMNFQGMRAHWSYATCGGVDSWSSSQSDKYCATQKSLVDCQSVGKCAWTGTECLTEEIARMCKVETKAASSSWKFPWQS